MALPRHSPQSAQPSAALALPTGVRAKGVYFDSYLGREIAAMCKVVGSAILTAALVAAALPASAQKSTDTLRVSYPDSVPDVTPYYNQQRVGVVIGHHVWDSLVYRDPETFQLKPLLAESYKWADDKTLEFTLRQDVTFHNGDKLTADDVVYTINSILTDKQVSTPSNYTFFDHATKLDDTHVRMQLKSVFPAALEFMAMTLFVMPKVYREKVGPQEYSQHPIAAGPYKITRLNTAAEVDLERYDGYYVDSPKGKPAIGKIVIRMVPDSATAMAELLGGRTDWIWKFSPDQFDAVARTAELAGDTVGIYARRVSRNGCGRTHRRGQSIDKAAGAPGGRLCCRSRHHGQATCAGRLARDRHPLLSDAVRLRCGRGGPLSVRSGEGKAVVGGGWLSPRFRYRAGDL